MKRRLAKLVVLLLLGAIASVAVAWGCALGLDDGFAAYELFFDTERIEVYNEYHLIEIGHALSRTSRLYHVEYHQQERQFPPTRLQNELVSIGLPRWVWVWEDYCFPVAGVYEAYGWPCIALCSGLFRNLDTLEFTVVSNGIVLGGSARPDLGYIDLPRVLPLRPIWPGFGFNTIFYAAILWLLAFGPFAARRVIRRKRRRCIKCGYDLRGASGGGGGCPECGWGREEKVEA